MSLKKWMVGLSLAALMVLVLTLNATMFSARSFQFDFARIVAESSGSLDIARFTAADAAIARVEAEAEAARVAAAEFDARLAPLRARDAELAAQLVTTRTTTAQGIAALEAKLNVQAAEAAALLVDAGEFEARVQSLASGRRLVAEDQASLAQVRQSIDVLEGIQTDAAQAADARQAVEREARTVGERVAQANFAIQAIKSEAVGAANYERYNRIRNEAMALAQGSPLGFSAMAAAWHPTQLSTVLVLSMGVLGAILYLFPAYMSRANPVTFAEIAVRVLFGMCTALAFYVVANAAVTGLGFAGGDAAPSGAQLNPFTLSMIGVVAGIMADDIAKWIHRRGTELLGGQVGVPVPDAQMQTPPPGSVGGLSTTADAAGSPTAIPPEEYYPDPQRGQ